MRCSFLNVHPKTLKIHRRDAGATQVLGCTVSIPFCPSGAEWVTRRKTPGRLARGFVIALGVLIAGCSGQGTISAVPFMRTDFGPTEPAVQTVEVNEAYYWLDNDGMLNISLRRHTPSILGQAFEENWVMSLKLEGLPAGSERLYHLGAESLREVSSRRGLHDRAASLMGVAVTHAPRGVRLEGRFHAVVRRQQFNALTGWVPEIYRAPMGGVAGTFPAGHDTDRGRAIRERATADGFGRISVRRHMTTHPVVTTRTR